MLVLLRSGLSDVSVMHCQCGFNARTLGLGPSRNSALGRCCFAVSPPSMPTDRLSFVEALPVSFTAKTQKGSAAHFVKSPFYPIGQLPPLQNTESRAPSPPAPHVTRCVGFSWAKPARTQGLTPPLHPAVAVPHPRAPTAQEDLVFFKTLKTLGDASSFS